ncbi:MAG TPA: hypothetical protein PLO33_09475 [Kouleothrix sp.]|mgnify:CR=1 FL=1|uniref:hypothetical protein n=1 Tax=Kouleothrix sp. TaxID=2779161 RepID=UPI002C5CC568|nr:hypothetical protein [Kouleothrix sp.]HRC75897.1 hypothetical protein [Kouleothrix sp.]
MAIDYAEQPIVSKPAVIEEQLFCSLSGKPISADTAYWAPPFVTASQLVRAIVDGMLHSPGTLSSVLFDEQPNVPYDPALREQLAARRSAEQLKLLVGLLAVIALIAVPIVLLAMR